MRRREEELGQTRVLEVVRPVALRLRHGLQRRMQEQPQPDFHVLRSGEVVALVADESDGTLRQGHRGGGEESEAARQRLVGHREVQACRQKGRDLSAEETAKTNWRSAAPGGSGASRRRQPLPSGDVRGTSSVPTGVPSANACTWTSGWSTSYARSPMTPPRRWSTAPATPRAVNRVPTGTGRQGRAT